MAEFTLAEKTEVALSGESGSGKTTFLNLIAGILKPDSGRLIIGGQEMSALSEPERDAWALLKRVGLGDRLKHYPRQLSTGQQQRVAVARALANGPKLVLADEPTGNLDHKNTRESLALIREACRENGAALLLVSHDARASQGEGAGDFSDGSCIRCAQRLGSVKIRLAPARRLCFIAKSIATGPNTLRLRCKISARWFVGLPVAFFLRPGGQFGASAVP